MDDNHSEAVVQDQHAAFLTSKDLQRELRIDQKLCYRLLKEGAIAPGPGSVVEVHPPGRGDDRVLVGALAGRESADRLVATRRPLLFARCFHFFNSC